MNIHGRKVLLRAINPGDLDRLLIWSNDPEIQQGLGGWHFPTSETEMRRWFDRVDADPQARRFAVVAPDLGLIGSANLVDINWKDRNAFHGMLLGDPAVRGKGYGHDTVMTIMRYAFDELGLHRLDGSMIQSNEASLRLYLGKCGWKHEGVQRDWYWRQGRFWDKELVGITVDDYQILIQQTDYWAQG